MDKLAFLEEELKYLEANELLRELKIVSTAAGPWVELSDGKRVLQLASNNYLGLANHPEVINASKSATGKYGVGASGSRLLSGTMELHCQLEKTIGEFEKSEGALLFSSGYSANVGVLSCLITKDDVVYSDELNHASIIDGIKLSGANKFIYKHNDTNDLEILLKENSGLHKKNFIITDTIFSMSGDVAPLKDIAELSEKYNCITIVDEAHATGIFGKNGSGLVEELGLEIFFPVKIGTCSKAIGVEGGFCSGPKQLIAFLQNKARSFIFSTSPSPAVLGGILKSIELIRNGNWRRERLWQNAKSLYDGLKKNYELKLNPFNSPIIIVNFDSIKEARGFSDRLFNECHIWAPVIRPPSVKLPVIRLTPIATHSEDDMKYVIKAFDYLSKDMKIDSLAVI